MSKQMQTFDCGDCPLYGGCLNICARSLRSEAPKPPARDLFEAAGGDLAPRSWRPCHGRIVEESEVGRRT